VRFFLDPDVPVEVGRVLRHESYQVTELREVLAVRASDVEVLNYAREHASFAFGNPAQNPTKCMCMETIDLTDGFDLKRIAQSWENVSAEHSTGLASILLFG
jgi:hypothetical protein